MKNIVNLIDTLTTLCKEIENDEDFEFQYDDYEKWYEKNSKE